MFKKKNRFYADFRTATGRKRKAFLTAEQARAYEAKQKRKVSHNPTPRSRSPK